MSAAFGKQKRLLDKRDFDAVMTPRGTPAIKVVAKGLVVFARARSNDPVNDIGSRLGLVVSRKVGNSPQRNLVKRIVRETFRNGDYARSSTAAYDIVVLARPELGSMGRVTIRASVAESFATLTRRIHRTRLSPPAAHEGNPA